ncbi:MAG: hypothetical protein JSR47_24990 [Proteobacteria bacterium]|nr:hypothetical protein [Pseudomonadota bacterium]
MKRIALIAGLIALAAYVGWSIFALVDAGITISYLQRGIGSQKDTVAQVRSMLQHATLGLGRAELLSKLSEDLKTASVVKEEDRRIGIGDVIFYFEGNAVSDVRILSQDSNY